MASVMADKENQLTVAPAEAKMAAAAPVLRGPNTALRVKRLSEHAILPTRGSPGAAGYDLSRYLFLAWSFQQFPVW